jgi:hypothetical protein
MDEAAGVDAVMSKKIERIDINLDPRAIGFVSGHGFSRAERIKKSGALAPDEVMTHV